MWICFQVLQFKMICSRNYLQSFLSHHWTKKKKNQVHKKYSNSNFCLSSVLGSVQNATLVPALLSFLLSRIIYNSLNFFLWSWVSLQMTIYFLLLICQAQLKQKSPCKKTPCLLLIIQIKTISLKHQM